MNKIDGILTVLINLVVLKINPTTKNPYFPTYTKERQL
jgi:hypothetical protein